MTTHASSTTVTKVSEESLCRMEATKTAREKHWTACFLITASSSYSFGMMLGLQAEQELWRRVFKGDANRNAQTQALLESASGAISFAINPLIAAHTDAFGRKPSMLFAQLLACLRCSVMVVSPKIGSMVFSNLARIFCFSTWSISLQASLGDLYKAEPQQYAKFNNYFQMIGPMMMAICPALGARVAQRDLRLPFVVGAALTLANAGMALAWFPETCQPCARVPFTFRSTNPLTFMKLLVNGSRLRRLALCEFFGGMAEGKATAQISTVQRQQLFQWTIAEQGRFQSLSGAVVVPSFTYIAPLAKALGAHASIFLGTGSAILGNVLSGLASKTWHLYIMLLLTSPFRMMSTLVLKAPTMQAATGAGLAQGELQGAISNIQTISRIIAPLVWSRLFVWGNARGRPNLFYFGVAFSALLQLLVAAGADLETHTPEKKAGLTDEGGSSKFCKRQ